MMKKCISWLLIIIGICMVLYPKVQDLYNRRQQKQIMEAWQLDLLIIGDVDGGDTLLEDDVIQRYATEEEGNSLDKNDIGPTFNKEYNMEAEGVLMIDKIDLKIPILTDATKENLAISVARITNTGKAGEIGNCCIAGHRSRRYGKHFNRLGELEEGDIVKIDNGEHIFSYVIFEKKIVKPTDIWILEGDGSRKLVTLITCDYSTRPPSRLIVRGELVE